MARREVYDCDYCSNANLPGTIRRFIVTGRSLDAAGDTDDEGDHVDLCSACCSKLLNFVLGKRDYKMNAAILERVKKKSG